MPSGQQIFKKQTQHKCFLWILQNFSNIFYLQLLLTILLQYRKFNWGVCSLISHLHVLLILIKNFYYHMTKSVTCLNRLNTCFWFQKRFRKSIICFRFWWKTYVKLCTNNYVISHLKDVLPALCDWSSVFNFRIWSGKQKNTAYLKMLN